jgi:hypothetical protein
MEKKLRMTMKCSGRYKTRRFARNLMGDIEFSPVGTALIRIFCAGISKAVIAEGRSYINDIA